MGIHVRRWIVRAALLALVLPASALAGASRIDPAAAGKACAGRHALRAPLGKAGAGRVAGLVSCVLRAERAQLRLGYVENRSLSRMVAHALGRFIALPYLVDHRPRAAAQAEQAAAAGMLASACHGAGPGHPRDDWVFGDAAPTPTLTPLQVAKLLAKAFQAEDAVARTARPLFGVAARRGLLFARGDLRGASVGLIAVVCR
jgi:hypothetical protein